MTDLQPKEEEEGEASQLQESEAVGSREDTHDLRPAALPAHPQSSRRRNIRLLCRRELRKQNMPMVYNPFNMYTQDRGQRGGVEELLISHLTQPAPDLLSHEQNLTASQPKDDGEASQLQASEAVGSREDTRRVCFEGWFLTNGSLKEKGRPLKKFSHGELVLATTNFSDDKKLGEGEFGSVYKGYLSDSNFMVAVKKIQRASKECKQVCAQKTTSIRTFLHENLVRLIGWSYNPGEFLLVSEFMPNGSLDTHLFGKKRTLTWPIRYKTALGLASALLYLHEEISWASPVVARRDIKSGNVMFDSSFTAKLGEFGLKGLIEQDRGLAPQTTMRPLNLGYVAPEYMRSRRAGKESDVYSFGVVALEIASGQKAANPSEEDSRMGLVDRIWNLYEHGRLLEAADERLRMDFDTKEMECLMIVGLWCAHPDYNLRPSIRQVIAVLHFEAEMPNLPNRMPVAVYMGSSSSAPSSQHSVTTSSIPLDG
ncbi:hypothetical protein AAC387_Pa02g3371 [Persea americana]